MESRSFRIFCNCNVYFCWNWFDLFSQITQSGSVIAAKATLGEDTVEVAGITLIALAHGFAIMYFFLFFRLIFLGCWFMQLVVSVEVICFDNSFEGHINPAVTWAVLITDRISILRAGVYFVSQIFGGILGSAILYSLIPEDFRFVICCLFTSSVSTWVATASM